MIKIGGSIITDPASSEPEPMESEMERTAEEISGFDGDLVVVHGAGSYGHPQAHRSDLDTGVQTETDRMDLARIQRLQNQLNETYCRILQEHGIPAFPLQPSSFFMMRDGEVVQADPSIVTGMLELGLVPVLNGVPAYDAEQDVSILSGDVIAPYIGDAIDADMVLHATSAEGVYQETETGEEVVERLTAMPDHIPTLDERYNVTGGMEGKVEALFRYGQDGRIFSGKEEGNIRRAFKDDVGTRVSP